MRCVSKNGSDSSNYHNVWQRKTLFRPAYQDMSRCLARTEPPAHPVPAWPRPQAAVLVGETAWLQQTCPARTTHGTDELASNHTQGNWTDSWSKGSALRLVELSGGYRRCSCLPTESWKKDYSVYKCEDYIVCKCEDYIVYKCMPFCSWKPLPDGNARKDASTLNGDWSLSLLLYSQITFTAAKQPLWDS